MRSYKALNKNEFQQNEFSIVPIRDKDKFDIMNWRNDQIFHLRQKEKLNKNSQEKYFKETVSNLFKINFPSQILFSFLKNDVCVGYGGLVHINWKDKQAEVSFIMNTELEPLFFNEYWTVFLQLIENVGFGELNLNKIFTYAFDVRPNLYLVLRSSGFKEEARLKKHSIFNDFFVDVVIHSKFNTLIHFRIAQKKDLMTYFNWINDKSVRMNSFSSETISLNDHKEWFKNNISNPNTLMLVFKNNFSVMIGQVRIATSNCNENIIGISIDSKFRSMGYGKLMLMESLNYFFKKFKVKTIYAYIKSSNISSKFIFSKAGFVFDSKLIYKGSNSYKYKYENK